MEKGERSTHKITLLLADDHTVVRHGIKLLLQAEDDLEVIGEADNGRQAIEQTRRLEPRVVLMDISLPGMSGLEAARRIRELGTQSRVLMLSTYSTEDLVQQSIDAGAAGYVVKQSAAQDLIKAIHNAARGQSYFSPAIARRMVDQYRQSIVPTKPVIAVKLTDREREIVQGIAEGLANKQIADQLSISIKTVEKHRQKAMNKLRIHDVAGLTRYAIDRGMVNIGPRGPLPSVPTNGDKPAPNNPPPATSPPNTPPVN